MFWRFSIFIPEVCRPKALPYNARHSPTMIVFSGKAIFEEIFMKFYEFNE
jgi:hypothetical protein